jgi:AcrR family transcriptional regulator
LNSERASRHAKVRRTRRTTEEVVDRLVNAAIEEFETKSYTGATMAAIARRAGVAEALLFNHIGSKAQLFQDTIFRPLEQHFDEFLASLSIKPGTGSVEETKAGTRKYVDALQAFVSERQGIFLSVVFAQAYKSSGIDGLAGTKGLHDYFSRMAELGSANLGKTPRISHRHVAKISFATIVACVLFRDWLFTEGVDDPDEVRTAVCDFVMEGLGANQPRR